MSDVYGNLVDRVDALKEEKVVLYDSKGRPLTRQTGFKSRKQ